MKIKSFLHIFSAYNIVWEAGRVCLHLYIFLQTSSNLTGCMSLQNLINLPKFLVLNACSFLSNLISTIARDISNFCSKLGYRLFLKFCIKICFEIV